MSTSGGVSRAGENRTVSLTELLEPWVLVPAANECTVSGIQLDSRQLREGDVFIALQGETVNGLDYLPQIISSGTAAVLVNAESARPDDSEKHDLDTASIAVIRIDDLSLNAGEIVSRFYADPSRSIKVIGVTGTDGKTSVCHLVAQALNENRDNCGVIGTLGWGFTGKLEESGLTTPDAVTLQTALSEFNKAGAGYAAMEVSSHALAQNRVSGILFDVAVLTNLGRDHLDYHGDIKSYRAAKEGLFYQPQLRAAVVNADDEFGISLMARLTDLELTTYGVGEGGERHVRYSGVTHSPDGLSFLLEYAGQSYPVNSGLLGSFNVANLASTFAVLIVLGLSPDLAARSLASLKPVPGRMETTRLKNGATVIVDYAHNPHALESVLQSVASHVEGRLIVVFGCGGERDQGKRPMMASIAERYAQRCIVTDDNPRNEDGDVIVSQILTGFENPDQVWVERDRRSAIQMAIGDVAAGDLVVVAGKGHEDYQLVGEKRLDFSDSVVVAEMAASIAL